MYTVYYYPFQQPWIAANLPFLNLGIATWQEVYPTAHYALVQNLSAVEFGQVAEAVQAGMVLGIKPGSHPQGNPVGK